MVGVEEIAAVHGRSKWPEGWWRIDGWLLSLATRHEQLATAVHSLPS
jgi:hypothetical protein